MTSRIAQWTLDAQDLGRMAGVLVAGARVRGRSAAGRDHHLRPPAGGEPRLWLQPGAEPKQGKNRDHLDLRAPDQAAEVERVIGLGATRVDVGQTGEEPFVVLAHPAGNEFCILR